MPDRRHWRWLAVLVAVAVLLPSAWSIPLAAGLVTGAIASWWWIRRVARRLEITCEAPPWASPEQQITATVVVRNHSRLPMAWAELTVPFAMGLGRAEPHRETITISAGASLERQLSLRPTHRGRYHVGPPKVRLGDVFGIADRLAAVPEPAQVTVFPRIVALDRLGIPAHSPFVTLSSPNALLADPISVAGVRDYLRGDPLSAVHWPATARTGDLAIKHYERAEARDTLVCLDLDPGSYPRGQRREALELAIIVAASVLHHAIVVDQLPAGLVTSAWDPAGTDLVLRLPARADRGHLRRMLELLALAQPNDRVGLYGQLETLGSIPVGTTVLAVGGRLDAGVVDQLTRLARSGAVAAALTGSPDADQIARPDRRLAIHHITELADVPHLATPP